VAERLGPDRIRVQTEMTNPGGEATVTGETVLLWTEAA
jgi:hypothetical protein